MKVLIEIPKEFENSFLETRFEDSLYRMYSDMHLSSGITDIEVARMLMSAFKNAEVEN